MSLAGRVAVVTGAGRGLGRAVAGAFAAVGLRVALIDITQDELRAAERQLLADGHTVRAFQTDITDEEAVRAMTQGVREAFGPVQVLVNAAAILEEQPFVASDFAAWTRTLAVNLTGPWLCTKAFLPAMRAARSGSIINVTSRAGIEPFAGEMAYCAAKFGLEGFSRSLALEVSTDGVAVNLITPGISIKPTSLTVAAFAALAHAERACYADPALLTPAFLELVTASERGITGQRFDAYQRSQQLRAEAGVGPG
jgi:NAD(P)-dependent dehydrogenase (short-subunit alcohol dehydrogenase family)